MRKTWTDQGWDDYLYWQMQDKTTLKQHRDPNQPTKAYSYEISNIEVLSGTARIVILPNDKTSMDVRILLNNVLDVNGMPILNQLVHKA